MSVATEITRLQTAKADLKTAIEGKGVTVPSATLISGYAALVEQISGGGGLPDSDGLADIEIEVVDMTDSASSITLTYTPTYLLRYSPSTPISDRSSISISKTVTYPSVVWSCNDAAVTISGSTANIQLGTDKNVVLTATWRDYNGETQTTSKTIHVMNLRYAMISAQSAYIPSGYVVLGSSPGSDVIVGPGGSLQTVTWYGGYNIAQCYDSGTYSYQWGTFSFMSNNGTSAASFSSVAEAQAAIDSM